MTDATSQSFLKKIVVLFLRIGILLFWLINIGCVVSFLFSLSSPDAGVIIGVMVIFNMFALPLALLFWACIRALKTESSLTEAVATSSITAETSTDQNINKISAAPAASPDAVAIIQKVIIYALYGFVIFYFVRNGLFMFDIATETDRRLNDFEFLKMYNYNMSAFPLTLLVAISIIVIKKRS